jgi:hypothetical protein
MTKEKKMAKNDLAGKATDSEVEAVRNGKGKSK